MAHRSLAPVQALVRELIPVVGSFKLNGAYVPPALAFATVKIGKLDTVLKSASNAVVWVELIGDSPGAGGVTIHEVVANHVLTIHFETGVSKVSDVETALAASTLVVINTPGTAGNTLVQATDAFGPTALVEANQPGTFKGLGFTAKHTAVGTYVVTFSNQFHELVSCKASLNLDTGADQFSQVGSVDVAAKTVTLFVWDKSDTALSDSGDRINFTAWFRNSQASLVRG